MKESSIHGEKFQDLLSLKNEYKYKIDQIKQHNERYYENHVEKINRNDNFKELIRNKVKASNLNFTDSENDINDKINKK